MKSPPGSRTTHPSIKPRVTSNSRHVISDDRTRFREHDRALTTGSSARLLRRGRGTASDAARDLLSRITRPSATPRCGALVQMRRFMRCPGPPLEAVVLAHEQFYVEISEESAASWVAALNARSADGTLTGAIVAFGSECRVPWWSDLDADGWLFCMARPREAVNRCVPDAHPACVTVGYLGRHRHGFSVAFRDLGPVMVPYGA